jgi:hypothetical protein
MATPGTESFLRRGDDLKSNFRRHQAAEFGVVLDDQYGSTFLLHLPHV